MTSVVNPPADVSVDLPSSARGPRRPSVPVLERRFLLSELLEPESLREVSKSFVELYRLGLKVFDGDGTKLVDIRVGNTAWCGHIFENPDGRVRCSNLVTRIKQHGYAAMDRGEVAQETCFSGLKYLIIPVQYGGDNLGRIVCGPYMPVELESPGAEVSEFQGFDARRLWELGEDLRRFPQETVERIGENFRTVVDSLVFTAMKAALTQKLHLESITSSYNDLSRANQELRASVRRLEELDRMKANFLAMISHELRTPLTSVIGYSEMLIEGMVGPLSDEQLRYCRTIKAKGESLLELIKSLLDMSTAEAGGLRLQKASTPIEEVVSISVTNVLPQAQKKGLHLENEVDGALDRVVMDRDKIVQCLTNLMGNAVKFTPNGGRIDLLVDRWRGQREASAEHGRFGPPEEDFIRFQVRDTGIGIPEDQLSKVFNQFFQVDNSGTREFGGTGLGLAIVKRFIEAHGGEVSVQSTLGSGTTFCLLLPLEPQVAD